MNPGFQRVERVAVLIGAAGLAVLVGLMTKPGERRRGAAFLLAWIVPGAGHVMLGKWRKGLFLFALLGATYLFGLWIVGFRTVSFDDNPFYYVGQYGSGATYLLAKWMSVEKAFPRPDYPPSWYDPGLLYVCVVGLLNLVVMLNVLDVKIERRAAPSADAKAVPAQAQAGAGNPFDAAPASAKAAAGEQGKPFDSAQGKPAPEETA